MTENAVCDVMVSAALVLISSLQRLLTRPWFFISVVTKPAKAAR